MVDAFHKAALASGGKDNGAPGERPYHPGYYAAFVLDPDGHNIEAVFHGEAKPQRGFGAGHPGSMRNAQEPHRTRGMEHPVTPDGRYFVIRGRLWRMSNPQLDPARREELVVQLMAA